MATEQEVTLAQDPATWVAVAVVIFFIFAYKKVWPKMAAGLDAHSVKIKEEIDQAARLKQEAQDLLAQAQRKAAEAERTANEILERAKFDSKQIADDAEREIEREIERKMKLAEEKIQRAEAQSLENIRKKAVESAIEAAKDILKNELAGKANKDKLVDKSIRLVSANVA
jgi:F-type H+-transporting ATPase subunit b